MTAQVDFLPDGHYQQDSITLEDQQRRMEVFNSAVDSYIAGRVYRLPVCGGCLSGCCRCVWLLVACLPVCLQSVCMTNQYASAVCGCSCCSGCLFSTLASLASNRRSLHRLTPPASPLPAVFVSAAGVDRRSMLEIECAAKIGLSGGPLYYRCVLYCCVHVLHCSWQRFCTAFGSAKLEVKGVAWARGDVF